MLDVQPPLLLLQETGSLRFAVVRPCYFSKKPKIYRSLSSPVWARVCFGLVRATAFPPVTSSAVGRLTKKRKLPLPSPADPLFRCECPTDRLTTGFSKKGGWCPEKRAALYTNITLRVFPEFMTIWSGVHSMYYDHMVITSGKTPIVRFGSARGLVFFVESRLVTLVQVLSQDLGIGFV